MNSEPPPAPSSADAPQSGEATPQREAPPPGKLQPPLDNAAPPEDPRPAKADPDTLVLRARPPRAVRFKRSVVVALSALAVSGVAVTAWLALRPPNLPLLGEVEETGALAQAPAEALAALPSSYAEAPQIGPPLPGDLGRAIVEQQRAREEADAALEAREREAQAERERIAEERRSARQSAILVRAGGHSSGPAVQAADNLPAASGARQSAAPGYALRVDGPGPGDGGERGEAIRIAPAPSPWLLSAGSVIAASLVTGLSSDLPGLVIAQVTERVYDSPTGQRLLIPQGARLIGSYDEVAAFGQRRARIVWQRLVFPDGGSLDLGDVPASDAAGYAGLEDEVDFHTGTLVKGAAISTLLGVGASLSFAGESDLLMALRESSQQNVSRAGDQLVSRDLQIRPTITIRPGTPVRLIVHRDLVLAPPTE